ncbi:MAG: hypothetical protein PHE58_02015, partial [Candidatus Omnitrophica bacterium]|nr:hypothetical protein [Candidatus Omnitrophota bacterium]
LVAESRNYYDGGDENISKTRIESVRMVLKEMPDTILGAVIFGSTARLQARDESDLDLIPILSEGTVEDETETESLFYSRIRQIAQTNVMYETPIIVKTSKKGELLSVIAMYFISPAQLGVKTFNYGDESKPLVTDWMIVARSVDEESHFCAMLAGLIAEARNKITPGEEFPFERIYPIFLMPDTQKYQEQRSGRNLDSDGGMSFADRIAAAADTAQAMKLLDSVGIAIDTRFSEAGLLHPYYIAHGMAVKNTVNEAGNEVTVLSGAAGAGVADAFLNTDARTLYCASTYFGGMSIENLLRVREIDINLDYCNRCASFDYKQFKYKNGYAWAGSLYSPEGIVIALATELKAMGVNRQAIVVDENRFGYPRINFNWAYYKNETKTRTVCFIDLTAGSFSDVQHERSYDMYYQRAAESLPLEYSPYDGSRSYIYDIEAVLCPGGYFITDDYAYHFNFGSEKKQVFPLDFPVKLIRLDQAVREAIIRNRTAENGENNLTHYGWDLTIRKKPAMGEDADGGQGKSTGFDITALLNNVRKAREAQGKSLAPSQSKWMEEARMQKHLAELSEKELAILNFMDKEPGTSQEEISRRIPVSMAVVRHSFLVFAKEAESNERVKNIFERHKRWRSLRPLFELMRSEPGLFADEQAEKLGIHHDTAVDHGTRLKSLSSMEEEDELREVFQRHMHKLQERAIARALSLTEAQEALLTLMEREPGISLEDMAKVLSGWGYKVQISTISSYIRTFDTLVPENKRIASVIERHRKWIRLRPVYIFIKTYPGVIDSLIAEVVGLTPEAVRDQLKRLAVLSEDADEDELKQVLETHENSKTRKSKTGKTYLDLFYFIREEPGFSGVEIARRMDVELHTISTWFVRLRNMADTTEEIRIVLARHDAWQGLRPLYMKIKTEPGKSIETIAVDLGVHDSTALRQLSRLRDLAKNREEDVLRKALAIFDEYWSSMSLKILLETYPPVTLEQVSSVLEVDSTRITRWFLELEKDESEDTRQIIAAHKEWRGSAEAYLIIKNRRGIGLSAFAKQLGVSQVMACKRIDRLEKIGIHDREVARVIERHNDWKGLVETYLAVQRAPGMSPKALAEELGIEKVTAISRLKRLDEIARKPWESELRDALTKHYRLLGIKNDNKGQNDGGIKTPVPVKRCITSPEAKSVQLTLDRFPDFNPEIKRLEDRLNELWSIPLLRAAAIKNQSFFFAVIEQKQVIGDRERLKFIDESGRKNIARFFVWLERIKGYKASVKSGRREQKLYLGISNKEKRMIIDDLIRLKQFDPHSFKRAIDNPLYYVRAVVARVLNNTKYFSVWQKNEKKEDVIMRYTWLFIIRAEAPTEENVRKELFTILSRENDGGKSMRTGVSSPEINWLLDKTRAFRISTRYLSGTAIPTMLAALRGYEDEWVVAAASLGEELLDAGVVHICKVMEIGVPLAVTFAHGDIGLYRMNLAHLKNLCLRLNEEGYSPHKTMECLKIKITGPGSEQGLSFNEALNAADGFIKANRGWFKTFSYGKNEGPRFDGGTIRRAAPAVKLLRLLEEVFMQFEVKESVDIFVTPVCPFQCDHCLAADINVRAREVPLAELKQVIDQLSGIKSIRLGGSGEPLYYGGKPLSESLWELVDYACERAGTVYIDTNGFAIPQGEEEFNSFLERLPRNAVLALSIDEAHEKEMKRRNKDLTRIIGLLEEKRKQRRISLQYNMRYPLSEDIESFPAEVYQLLDRYGLRDAFVTDRDIFNLFHIIAEGNAARDDFSQGARDVDVVDIVNHSTNPRKYDLYIAYGEVVVNAHAAFISERPRHAVLGDVRREKLFDIFLNGLFGRFIPGLKQNKELMDLIMEFVRSDTQSPDFTLAEKLRRCWSKISVEEYARRVDEVVAVSAQQQVRVGNNFLSTQEDVHLGFSYGDFSGDAEIVMKYVLKMLEKFLNVQTYLPGQTYGRVINGAVVEEELLEISRETLFEQPDEESGVHEARASDIALCFYYIGKALSGVSGRSELQACSEALIYYDFAVDLEPKDEEIIKARDEAVIKLGKLSDRAFSSEWDGGYSGSDKKMKEAFKHIEGMLGNELSCLLIELARKEPRMYTPEEFGPIVECAALIHRVSHESGVSALLNAENFLRYIFSERSGSKENNDLYQKSQKLLGMVDENARYSYRILYVFSEYVAERKKIKFQQDTSHPCFTAVSFMTAVKVRDPFVGIYLFYSFMDNYYKEDKQARGFIRRFMYLLSGARFSEDEYFAGLIGGTFDWLNTMIEHKKVVPHVLIPLLQNAAWHTRDEKVLAGIKADFESLQSALASRPRGTIERAGHGGSYAYREEYMQRIRSVIPFARIEAKKNKIKVADFGCGDGHAALSLAQSDKDLFVTGVDAFHVFCIVEKSGNWVVVDWDGIVQDEMIPSQEGDAEAIRLELLHA